MPDILTDDIFVAYGGATGTTTAAQREAAYDIAESQAAEEVGTFLQPTDVTGTYSWPIIFGIPLQLPYTYLNSVASVTSIHEAGCDCADDSIELEGCAWIKDAPGGLVDLRECGNTLKASCSGCRCGGVGWAGAYQARIVYNAGLPASAASDSVILMALTVAARLALEQITDPEAAAGGAGDPGIKSFRSLTYSETRAESSYKNTAFGSSAKANYAANLLKVYKYKRAFKMGW